MSNDTNNNGSQDDNFANFSFPGGDDPSQQTPATSHGSNEEGTLDENVPSVDLSSDEPVASGSDSPDMNTGKPADLDAQMANLSGLGTPDTPTPAAEPAPEDSLDPTPTDPSQSESDEQVEAPTVLGEGEVKVEEGGSTSPLQALASRLSSIKGGLVEETVESSEDDMAGKVDDAATVDPVSQDSSVEEDNSSSEQDVNNLDATTVAVSVDSLEEETATIEAGDDTVGTDDEQPAAEIDINAPTPLTDQLVSETPVPNIAGSEIADQPIVQIDPDLNDSGGKDMNAPVMTESADETTDSMTAMPDLSTNTTEPTMQAETTEEMSDTAEMDDASMEPTPTIADTIPEAPATPDAVMPAPAPAQEVAAVLEDAPPPLDTSPIAPPVAQIAMEADDVDPLVGGEDAPKVAHSRYPYTIEQLLDIVVEKDASDLHLTVGYPAMIRVDGALLNVLEEVVTEKQASDLIFPVLPEQKKELLDVNREVDLAHAHREDARFRINAYYQKQTLAAAFRLIPNRIRSVDELNLPQIYHQLTKLRQGLVLVTGPTGSGKSTTLAAILQEINESRPDHIITIEDPVEYILPKARAMVDQRELHEDTHSWEIAMRSALRQDPDVVLVGEMRDYETIAAAITLAETGHLVFATLHTNSAAQTLDRIVDVFPEHQQAQVRSQLSNTIEAVIAQRLMPINRGGRVAVSEIMIATPAIRNLIREAKTHQIDNVIRTSADIGMISLEHTLVKMVRDNTITMERAQEYAVHPEEVVRLLKS